MTLIVALEGKDGLLLAADSRGTIGDPRGLTAISDAHQKIFKLSDYCGVGVSGASELAAKLVDELTGELRKKNLHYVNEILTETRDLVRTRYNDWFGQFPLDRRPSMILTLIGYNRTETDDFVPRIYLLGSQLDFAPQLFTTGAALSGIPQYAIYLLHRLYDREMTIHNLSALATYLIVETASQDPKVGGPVRIAQITPDRGYVELPQSEIESIIQRNEEQNRKLRQFFFEGG